ncbi:response regulator [Methanosarcina sp. KYL-1]|uniref:response regulator n=1 Tax=Methanosarcina sp. KYL-1 TaxID=2602068 RepID=UPI0021015F28|nr:response regulator [Methanosarcina sp. KYL-1]MCQ1536993.1 response regulator [Methanosarcina sp. KYL-1]
MNVSKKVLVIIYLIFALLTSVVIFASQNILDSSFSEMEQKEVVGNVAKVKNVLEFQVRELDEINYILSSRDDIRAFMLMSPDPEHIDGMEHIDGIILNEIFSLTGYDTVFLVNSSGSVIYSQTPDSEHPGVPVPFEILRSINDNNLLCTAAGDNVKGLLLLEGGPMIISSRPVLSGPESEEVLGTLILGEGLDEEYVESLRVLTGNPLMLYRLDSIPSDFQQAFFESKTGTFVHPVEGGRMAGYFVLDDIKGNPAVMVRTDMDRNIYAEGQESLRYIVLFLLFAGLMVGAGCKLLLDREVVSRIVAIDSFVEKVGKKDDSSDRLFVEGDDELSRLAERINGMLGRLNIASEELKAKEHEKKVILNSLSELLVFLDPELRIIWANKAFLDFVGLKLEYIIGRSHDDVCVLYEMDPEKSPVRRVLKSGNEEVEELLAPDGKVWMVRAGPIKDEEGRVTGVLQAGLDITAHKHSEERLLQAKLEAEGASRTKSEFLANMSHELRTPLNSIIGFSDILLEKVFGELNGRQLKYINNISNSGKHLLKLINDILDLSKVEAGKMELYYSEFSPASLFEEVWAVFSPLARARSLEVVFNMEPGFTSLEADRSRLFQILSNLISNAIKFTPEGGKVFVSCKKEGGMAFITVADTGIGISGEDQKKLFQPFTQIDASAARQYCGTGLGLALVKKLVNLHRGEIRVESDLMKGSSFTFSLPLRNPQAIRKTGEAELEGVLLEFEMNKKAALSVKEVVEEFKGDVELPVILSPENGGKGKPLILVVDDDKNSNELLRIVLVEAGYRVASIYNGRTVLAVAKELKPDVITLDVFMPDANGWLVLRQLKNDPEAASIPVLIISMTDKNELGIALGATYSFTKPVKKPELMGSLGEITQKFRFESPKVLIVDDDENAVELLNSMIEPEGFEVVKAYGGQDGMEKLFSVHPDILILDLMMPEVSGFDVISSMREDLSTKDLPLIVCTAGEFTEKNIEELNEELKGHLLSIMKKGTFGRKELINRINQLTMLKRHDDERDSDC